MTMHEPSPTPARSVGTYTCPMDPGGAPDGPGRLSEVRDGARARRRRRRHAARVDLPDAPARSCATRRAAARSAAWRSSRGPCAAEEREPRARRHDAAVLGRRRADDAAARARDGRRCCPGSRSQRSLPTRALPGSSSRWRRRSCSGAAGRSSCAAGQSLVNRSLNMFTLIALGVGAAYGYSVVATLAARHVPRVVPRCTAARRRSTSRRRR